MDAVWVLGLGSHYPSARVDVEALLARERPGTVFGAKLWDLLGCRAVRGAGPEDTPASLALAAGRAALASAGLAPTDLDLVASVGCVLPDVDVWSLPAKVAQGLGLEAVECFGLGDAACAGAYAAMRGIVPILLADGGPRRALLVSGNLMPGDRFFAPATIFGDGGGAFVLGRGEGPGLARVVRADLHSTPTFIDAFGPTAGLAKLRREGRLVPQDWTFGVRDPDAYHALRKRNFDLGAAALGTTLARAGWSVAELTWLLPDNVTFKVGEELAKRTGLDPGRIWKDNAVEHGHAFAADLFANLAAFSGAIGLRRGDRLASVGMGLGQHWGVVLFEID